MQYVYIHVLLTFLSLTLCSHSLKAQIYPADFGHVVVATGIKVPTAVAFAPDGRIFMTEQTGNVRIIKNNVLLTTPFVRLSVDSQGERGLLGIAIDPDFLNNKYVYVYYTVAGSPARNRIARFSATNDVASAGSETVILDLGPLSTATIHNGGAIHFGKDGKLYVAVGENANQPAAQNLDTYHGKLLRINKDGSVPQGNPFPTGSEQRRRVWAYGLRNPFTFSIDQETGKIFVNDVGQGLWEEINDATQGGRNFGWPMTEGSFNPATFPNLTNPVYAYGHGNGDGVGCAIVGGAFVSPSNTNYPASYRGKYFFQDNCNNWINTIDISGGSAIRSPFATSIILNSLGMTAGIDGHIYYIARHWEGLIKIVYNKTTTPTITNHPATISVAKGQPVSFAVSALGAGPLAYQWQKNGINIPGATNSTFRIAQATETDAAQYRVAVSNAAGSVISNPAILTVISNAPPVAEIISPVEGATYDAGTTVNFSGKGNDPEQGPLSAQAFSWAINFHHNTHKHDQPAINGISSGSFSIPNIGETSDNVWYRVILTVTDANGLKGKDSVDIIPLKSTINFATVPPGLELELDGQPLNSPASVVSVEGLIRTLNVRSPQMMNNKTYEFISWDHGGDKSQTITTPVDNINYTANFKLVENVNTFYRAININGPSLVVDGNNWEASSTARSFSAVGIQFSDQNVPLIPSTDIDRTNMIRSSIWGNPSVSIGAVPLGDYQVWIYVWEDNFPVTFSISLENNIVQSNINSGVAGSWKKLGPFSTTIVDGTINLSAIGLEANFSGIEIWHVGKSNGLPYVANPIPDQNAVVGTIFTYKIPDDTFVDPDAGSVLTYSATLSDGSPLPSWLNFIATDRSFNGTPNSSAAGTLEISVTASDGVGGNATDVFALAIKGPEESKFYRAININGASLVIDGYNWEAGLNAPNFSATGIRFADQNIRLDPSTDANRANMIRSCIWGSPSVSINAVPRGTYQVSLYVWEDNFPVTFSISLEGMVVEANIGSGRAGTWKKLGPYEVAIDDGTINVSAIGTEANFSGIEIWSVGTNPQLNKTLVAARIPSETLNEWPNQESLELSAYPNPFSQELTIAFSAVEASPTTIQMYDMRGRKIRTIFHGAIERGHREEILLDPAGLTNGIYILEMVNGVKTKRLKIMMAP